jgi:flagellar biosynthetic protein FliR
MAPMDKGLPGLLPGSSEAEGLRFVYAFLRLAGFFLAAPLFSSRLLPMRFRLALAAVAAVCVAASLPRWTVDTPAPAGGLLPGAGEVLLGAALAWSAFVALGAVRGGAVFISDQIGLSLGGVIDPSSEGSEPALRGLSAALAVFIFVSLDLHHAFLRFVVESFTAAPPGALSPEAIFPALGNAAATLAGGLFRAAAVMAMPVTAALLLVSVTQGVLSRVLPEMELFVLGFPLRALVGLGALAILLPASARWTQGLLEGALRDGRGVLEGLLG